GFLGDLFSNHHMDVSNELAAAYNNRGAAYHRLGSYEEARSDYTQAIKLRTELLLRGRLDLRNELALTYTNRAIMNQCLQQSQDAILDYTRAIELRHQLVEGEGRLDLAPELAQVHSYRGQVYRALGRLQEAQEDYQRAIAVYTALSVTTRPSRELARTHDALGVVQLDLNQLEDALLSCNRSLELYAALPASHEVTLDTAVALNNRGEVQRRLGLYSRARDDFDRALSLYEGLDRPPERECAVTRQNRARVHLQLGDLRGALDDSTRAMHTLRAILEQQGRGEVLPHLVAAYATRGTARVRLKELEAGLRDLARAIDLYRFMVEDRDQADFHEDLAGVYRQRSRALLELGKISYDTPDRLYYPRQALEDLNRALQHYDQTLARERNRSVQREMARTRLERSFLHEDLADYPAAVLDASQAAEFHASLGPEGMADQLECLKRRAEIYLRSGQYEQALSDYLRIASVCREQLGRGTDLRGDLAEALNNVGWTRTCLGQYQDAFQEYAQALDLYRKLVVEEKQLHLGKNLAWTYNNRAATHNVAGNPKAALEDYGNAVEIYEFLVAQGGFSELRPRLATTLQNRGLLFQGMAIMDRALKDFSQALEVRAQEAREKPNPEALAELATAFSTRGLTYHRDGKIPQALADYREASAIYSDLVENRRRPDLGNELARCLLAQSVLGPDPSQDAEARHLLVRAIQALSRTVRAGFQVTASFPLHFARVAAGLTGDDPELARALNDLTEALRKSAVHMPDPVGYADFVVQFASRLGRNPVRASLLASATSMYEKAMQEGKERATARLIHGLHKLGEALETAPAVEGGLAGIGACFAALQEKLKSEPLHPEGRLELEVTVRLWQSLPPTIPAQAQLSRFTLQAILRQLSDMS
ncbi:MAG: tetratricopeptide repeat protein, partial [Candidatus Eremiobacterota bacterium]